MNRSVFWRPLDEIGLEHLRFEKTADALRADGVILQTKNDVAYRARYRIEAAPDWSMRRCAVSILEPNGAERRLALRVDANGHWHDEDANDALTLLAGCHEVDIEVTPFTNSLAIGRLRLKPGQASEILAAYLTVPELTLSPQRQRYTALAAGHFRYEAIDSGFSADLSIDADGLVLDYPGIFERVGAIALA